MPYRWQDILQDWSLGGSVDYEKEDVVNAFNDVERIMGPKWLGLAFGQSRGTMVAIQIIDLGMTLKTIESIPNASKLISKIRNLLPKTIFHGNRHKKPDPSVILSSNRLHELAHSLQVARLIAHYRRHSFEVEVEPELPVRTEIKRPDFRVRYDKTWVYVEVVCPGFSKEAQNVNKILARIANVNKKLRMDRVAEIFLFKDPSDTEINQIISKCRQLAEKDIQPQEYIMGNTAQIFTNPWNQERLPKFTPAVEEKRPILGIVEFEIKHDKGVAHGRKCNVKMPITDERAQKILYKKSRQLSKTNPGLIVVGVSGVPGGLKRWPELIRRRLQPRLNRRISGVLITESAVTGKSLETRKRFIEHPNPIHPLDQGFVAKTIAC